MKNFLEILKYFSLDIEATKIAQFARPLCSVAELWGKE
jgi:hypothetical protein